MKRKTITITHNGNITVPNEAKMSIPEIADLFGIFYRTAKRHIRSIEKSGIAEGDYSMTCRAEGSKVYPVYYGLEMVIAVAFRVQSAKTKVFREWIIRKADKHDVTATLISPLQNSMLN